MKFVLFAPLFCFITPILADGADWVHHCTTVGGKSYYDRESIVSSRQGMYKKVRVKYMLSDKGKELLLGLIKDPSKAEMVRA